MATTDRFGLSRIGAGQNFSEDGYKYTDADRVLMDRLLYLGAEAHHHTGQTAAEPSLTGLSLTVTSTAGSIPAGTRVYYKYTLVDVNGLESLPSTESYVDTPAAVTEPAASVLNASTTGGILLPGNYYYVLTAYTNSINTQETKALNPAYVTVPVGTTTNRVTMTFPTLPPGATGWNIYRKKPGSPTYYYLASVAMNVVTPPTTYIDTGTVDEDCNRTIPTRNTTNNTNAVTAALGATPVVPVGYTWKLYRTYVAGNYDNSLVHWVVEETAEGSGVITPAYVDFGLATYTGKPPVLSQVVSTPSKIDLANAAEVSGRLPMGAVSAFPFVVTFHYAGPLSLANGTALFVLDYPQATIIGVRASLGRGYSPAATDVIVDVERYASAQATPTWGTIFTDQTTRPKVVVGSTIGTRVTPQVTELVAGDALVVNIEQVGGGASPTDRDLTVHIYMYAYGWGLTSHPWNGA